MTFHWDLGHRRGTLRLYGWTALLLLAGFLGLSYAFAARMSPEEAADLLREHLAFLATQRHLTELQDSGRSTPGFATAERWEAELQRLKHTDFVSIDVKRALLVPPFREYTCFVVRAVSRDRENRIQTRYYWFFQPHSFFHIRETSESTWRWPI